MRPWVIDCLDESLDACVEGLLGSEGRLRRGHPADVAELPPHQTTNEAGILALGRISRICGIAASKFGDEAAHVTLWWVNPG
jgi:hypothetical protein